MRPGFITPHSSPLTPHSSLLSPHSSLLAPPVLSVTVKVNSGQVLSVNNGGISVMHDVKVAAAAVAEPVTGESADDAVEVGGIGQGLAQLGAVDVERISMATATSSMARRRMMAAS